MCVDSSDVLRQVVVPIINWDECRRLASRQDVALPEKVICAGHTAGGKSSCYGDSGGPLVCKKDGQWWQYGVVNFGLSDACARPNQPGAYADVVKYLRWIEQNSGSSLNNNGR